MKDRQDDHTLIAEVERLRAALADARAEAAWHRGTLSASTPPLRARGCWAPRSSRG